VQRRLHRFALRVFRRLPVRARRRVVRTLAPGFTVGAICLIERPDGAVLLVRQSYRNAWGVPGGLLKRRETPEDAARREVFEEVGLDIELVGEPAVVVEPEAQRVDLVFRARPVAGHDPITARPMSPEITECAWFATDALPDLQAETSGALVALARSATNPQAVPLPAELRVLDRRTRPSA
jgi:ADP-ribose pyrophosphatase YjhB (NUDIX family)